MIDKVDEPRRNGDLAQDFVFVPAGDGRDLGEVLRLQGDGLGGQSFAEFRRQGLGQVAAPIQRDAETAGIRPLRSGVIAGGGQGGGKEKGCDSGFHFSNLKTNFTRSHRLFQPALNPGFCFKHRRSRCQRQEDDSLIRTPKARTNARRKSAVAHLDTVAGGMNAQNDAHIHDRPATAELPKSRNRCDKSGMKYRRFGRTELAMPVISCGGMRYQYKWQDVPPAEIPADNQANLEATIHRAWNWASTTLKPRGATARRKCNWAVSCPNCRATRSSFKPRCPAGQRRGISQDFRDSP